jgi:hypothetical protein
MLRVGRQARLVDHPAPLRIGALGVGRDPGVAELFEIVVSVTVTIIVGLPWLTAAEGRTDTTRRQRKPSSSW